MHIENLYYFWRIAADIMVNHEFELIQLDEENNEIWLEKTEKSTAYVIRLKQQTFDWSNQLTRDQELVTHKLKKIQRILVGRKIEMYNVYISQFPPVDEQNMQDLISEIKGRKPTSIHHLFITKEDRDKHIAALYQKTGLTEKPFPLPEEEEMEQMIPYLKESIRFRHQKNKKETQSVFTFGKPILTFLFIAINLLAFLWLEMQGGSTNTANLVQYGAKYNPGIVEGEWWRVISSMFLHIGFFHLALNMLALYYLGTAVERMYGSLRFIIIYFLSGIIGGLASFAFNSSVAAGASGAIYGLFGALLFFGIIYKKLFFRTMGSNLLFILGLNIVFSFTVPQIDNGAHFGGLIGGFIASSFLHFPKKRAPFIQGMSFVGILILIVGLGWYGLQNSANHYEASIQTQLAHKMNTDGNYEETITFVTNTLQHTGEDANLLFLRSYAYVNIGKTNQATSDLQKVIELNSSFPEAHFNLSILYSKNNQREEALKHARKALELKPDNEEYISHVQSLEKSG